MRRLSPDQPTLAFCASVKPLALIERALVLAADENLHRIRAMTALTLGDANRLVESSAYLVSAVNSYLSGHRGRP